VAPRLLIAPLGGIVLLVSLFLPWYTRDAEVAGAPLTSTWSAWESVAVTAAVLFVVAAAAIGLSAARAAGFSLGGLRVGRLLFPLGLVALALIAWRLIDLPIDALSTEPGDSSDDGRGVGLLVALVGAAAIAYGGRIASE
jgi:hypothetical protein